MADEEWEEVVGEAEEDREEDGEEDGEAQEVLGGAEEDDLEPLPPGWHRKASGTSVERGESSLTVGGAQVQGRVASSVGQRSCEILSSASRDSNPQSSGSWAHGGTPVQRRVTSSLGRRSRDNLFSEAWRNSNLADKRLHVGSALAGEVPSSLPSTLTGCSNSLDSDMLSRASGKSGSRKY